MVAHPCAPHLGCVGNDSRRGLGAELHIEAIVAQIALFQPGVGWYRPALPRACLRHRGDGSDCKVRVFGAKPGLRSPSSPPHALRMMTWRRMNLICLLRLQNCLSLVRKRGLARRSSSSSWAGSDCIRSCWRQSATCARAKMQQRRGQPLLKDRYLG